MRAIAITTLAVVLLAGTARAGLLEPVEEARAAFENRRAEIDSLLDPTKDQQREWKKLGKAMSKLSGYLGDDDQDDVEAIVKAIKKAVSSRTLDPVVLGALEQLGEALDQLCEDLRNEAITALAEVREDKRRKVQKQINKGDARREEGLAEWAENAKKGAVLMLEALERYWKALRKAEKYHEDPPAAPSDLVLLNTTLYNNSDHDVQLLDIEYSVIGLVNGSPVNYSGKATDHVIGVFPITIASMDSYDLLVLAAQAVNDDPQKPELQQGDYLVPSITLKTTEGDIKSGF